MAAGVIDVDHRAAGPAATAKRPRKPILPALIAAAVGALVVVVPAAISTARVPPPSMPTVFPAQVASYSWFTAHGDLGMPATMVFQNGVGVEFMDFPQAVALGADGSTYRRIGTAEARGIPADQGDPADMVLAADGTFAVIAGAGGHGNVIVHSFVDGTSRPVPVGAGRSAIPLSIASDGDHVLVLLSDTEMSPYTSFTMSLDGTLALLELSTGDLVEYDLDGVRSAAISPDGTRIVAETANGAVVLDASGRGIQELPSELADARFAADAWSTSGTHVATVRFDPAWVETEQGRVYTSTAALLVTDLSAAVAEIPLADVEAVALLGWRADDTLVVQRYADDNSAQFQWVDASTGAAETFATYDSGFTGASVASADLARDLISVWAVEERPVDRGWNATIVLASVVGLLAGFVVWIFTPRRKN